jgi:hypothetical protein
MYKNFRIKRSTVAVKSQKQNLEMYSDEKNN